MWDHTYDQRSGKPAGSTAITSRLAQVHARAENSPDGSRACRDISFPAAAMPLRRRKIPAPVETRTAASVRPREGLGAQQVDELRAFRVRPDATSTEHSEKSSIPRSLDASCRSGRPTRRFRSCCQDGKRLTLQTPDEDHVGQTRQSREESSRWIRSAPGQRRHSTPRMGLAAFQIDVRQEFSSAFARVRPRSHHILAPATRHQQRWAFRRMGWGGGGGGGPRRDPVRISRFRSDTSPQPPKPRHLPSERPAVGQELRRSFPVLRAPADLCPENTRINRIAPSPPSNSPVPERRCRNGWPVHGTRAKPRLPVVCFILGHEASRVSS